MDRLAGLEHDEVAGVDDIVDWRRPTA